MPLAAAPSLMQILAGIPLCAFGLSPVRTIPRMTVMVPPEDYRAATVRAEQATGHWSGAGVEGFVWAAAVAGGTMPSPHLNKAAQTSEIVKGVLKALSSTPVMPRPAWLSACRSVQDAVPRRPAAYEG